MKNNIYLGIVCVSCTLISNLAHGQQVFNFATGLDSGGTLQTAGDLLDANWSITGGNTSKNGSLAGQAFTVDSANADWFSGWQANGPGSSWITQNPDSNNNGLIVATYTFTLAASQLASATFSGMAASLDDYGDVKLNGVTEVSGLNYPSAGTLTNFTVNSSDLVAGLNTLKIEVTSSDNNLEAVRLQGQLSAQPVPEPKSIMLGVAATLVYVIRRRVR